MASGSTGATRTIRIVYEVDGVEAAVDSQDDLKRAVSEAGEALGRQSEHAETAGRSMTSLSELATRSEQAQSRMLQQTHALASGLQGLAGIIGTESEAGALVGRMGQFAAVGTQLGTILGPGGAIVGGITGALIPAFESVITSIQEADRAERDFTITIDTQAASYDSLLESIRSVNAERSHSQILSMGLGSLEEQQAAVALQERTLSNLNETSRALSSMAASEENLRALTAVGQARTLTESRLAAARDALAQAQADMDADAADFVSSGRMPGDAGPDRQTRRRGGGTRRREAPPDITDALRFASGLGSDQFAPDSSDVFAADAQRQERNRRFGGQSSDEARATQAQLAAIREVRLKQKEAHDEQMDHVREQVDAWNAAAGAISSSLFKAFTTTVSGAESADVAFTKSFKNIAMNFGMQMVNEGTGALLTAVGNSIMNEPVAATKYAEGFGKIALGVGLGAAGAAIPVPAASGGGSQTKPPRLGPEQGASGTGGSVIVNMNAPAIVTGTRAELGREVVRAGRDATQRYGRAA